MSHNADVSTHWVKRPSACLPTASAGAAALAGTPSAWPLAGRWVVEDPEDQAAQVGRLWLVTKAKPLQRVGWLPDCWPKASEAAAARADRSRASALSVLPTSPWAAAAAVADQQAVSCWKISRAQSAHRVPARTPSRRKVSEAAAEAGATARQSPLASHPLELAALAEPAAMAELSRREAAPPFRRRATVRAA